MVDSSDKSGSPERGMSDVASDPKDSPKKKWGCLRRVGIVFLILILIFLVFHRPIVFELTRYLVVRVAKQQNIDLDYEIEGTIFTRLRVQNLVGKPTEKGPLERLEIGELLLEYSLIGLIFDGFPGLLEVVEARDVYVVVDPDESLPPEKQDDPQAFKFPALYPKKLVLENINFTTIGPEGDFVLAGVRFTLFPERPGELKIETLAIPGFKTWQQIRAETTFVDRNLLLKELVLGPEIQLEAFNLNASRLNESVLSASLHGKFVGSHIVADAVLKDLNRTNELALTLRLEHLVLPELWSFIEAEVPLSGEVNQVEVGLTGIPEEPHSWTGYAYFDADKLSAEDVSLGALRATAALIEGKILAQAVAELGPENQALLFATGELPAEIENLDQTTVKGRLDAFLNDVGGLAKSAGVEGSGRAEVAAEFALANQNFTVDYSLESPGLSAAGVSIENAAIHGSASKALNVPEGSPPFKGAKAYVAGTVEKVGAEGIAANDLVLKGNLEEANFDIEHLSLNRGRNRVNISAQGSLPDDMESFADQPLTTQIDIDAPALEDFIEKETGVDLRGSLSVKGDIRNTNGELGGEIDIRGRDIVANNLNIQRIDGSVQIRDQEVQARSFEIVLNEKNKIVANGTYGLESPNPYSGTVTADLANLSVFNPLSPEPLGGSVNLSWSGSGEVATEIHRGAVGLQANNVSFGKAVEGVAAEVRGTYDWPKSVDLPVVDVRHPMGRVRLSARLANDTLAVTGLAASLKDLQVLSGSLQIPLVAEAAGDLDQMIPANRPLQVDLRTGSLALSSLFAKLPDTEAPVSGTVEANLTVGGTLSNLQARLAFDGRNLRAVDAGDVQPADVSLTAQLANDALSIDGAIRQPQIQPLVIQGRMPVDVEQVIDQGQLPPSTPINLSVRMPRSSLRFVTALVPTIRLLEGSANIDVSVTGTLQNPVIGGIVDADIQRLRLAGDSFPPIVDTSIRIRADRERAVIDQFQGSIAGGSFSAAGSVTYSNPAQPSLDIVFRSNDALVAQDEALTLRVDSDVRITGPLESASVTGGVYATKSRFFKNIDILPIGLPGRPAPQPPEPPPPIGIPQPPLSNWTFDVAVATADPFIVAGNLANGRITANLRLGGTGAQPWLDGEIRIEQLTTSLPFSEMTFQNSVIYFLRDQPFIAQLDLRGTSEIRSYLVRASIYGSMLDPQVVFSSEPPLPQTDIVSLIATGTTTEELGDPSVLAGRAAILLFRKISQTLFPTKNRGDRKPTILDDIDISLGQIDPKTGRQSASVRFPLTDNVVLIGGVDVTGNFRGQIKYLIRFR